MKKFWTNVSGSYKIDPESLIIFLADKNFGTYKPQNISEVVLISVSNRIIRQVTSDEIRNYCWNYIYYVYQFQDDEERRQVIGEYYRNKSLFSRYNLKLLSEIKINEISDTKEKGYLFFKNCILEITADKIIKKSYDEVEGQIFNTDLIDDDFTMDIPDNYNPGGEFYEFMKDLTANKNKIIQQQNLDSLITVVGYMLHRYKDPANAKAIIIMDPEKDGTPNGGTGKGLFTKAFEYMKKSVYQDGKSSSASDRFRLSNVEYGTRILVFDDVPKDFNFEKIFPLITEKAVIERKYENKITIPFDDSPKILITTNYTIEGKGSSHRRRKVEFIFSDTYDDTYSPEDKYGHLFFSEWSNEEWQKFYMLMAYSLQMFLLHGIVKPEYNVAERRLRLEASKEFIDFIEDHDAIGGVKYNKKDVYEEFLSKYPDHKKIEQNTFTKWLRLFADAYGFEFHESHSGDDLFFEFTPQ